MQQAEPGYKNLLDMLEKRVEENPQKIAYTFLEFDGKDKKKVNLTYSDVYENAKIVACHLKKHGVGAGDRVIIFSTQTYDNIYSIFGAIFAQAVFILIPPPIDEGKKIRFKSVLESSGAKLILCNDLVAQKLEKSLYPKYIPSNLARWIIKKIKDIEILSVTGLKKDSHSWTRPDIAGETMVYLQYSSGSTSAPKGVKISHRNVIHNLAGLKSYFGESYPQNIISWAPFFHNMGLLSAVFGNINGGGRSVIMSPLAFMKDPGVWFKTITEYRGDAIFASNSAYEFCTRMIPEEQPKEFDLSSVQTAANGAEPINYEVIEAFSKKFSKCGFRQSVFRLGYGLAESTCFVACSRYSPNYLNIDYESFRLNRLVEIGGNKRPFKQIAGVGKPISGMEALIVDPVTHEPCDEDEIGELWIRGESVAEGYWEDEAETDRVFRATAVGREGFYMRTGDLAAFYKGEIYIVGRLKELIIINGHNIVPQDIEMCVWEYVPELAGCPVVSFAVDAGGKERFVTCIEFTADTDRDYDKLCEKINMAVHKVFSICPSEILYLNDRTIPRADNGKIQVLQAKNIYDSGRLEAVYRTGGFKENCGSDASADSMADNGEDHVEARLIKMVETVVGNDVKIKKGDNLFSSGIDSMGLVQLTVMIEREYGISLSVEDIAINPTVDGIACMLESYDEIAVCGHQRQDASLPYKDCILDDEIVPESDSYCGEDKCRSIFITGATGFIGAYLVKYLMKFTNAKIFCLVRSDNAADGLRRIKQSMTYYKVWEDGFEERLIAVTGDLSKPGFGIEKDLYDELCSNIDTVYHGGALLNFIYPYSLLRDINVKGTVECLRFACQGKAKYFNYISTYSVFDNPSHFGSVAFEDDSLQSGEGYLLAYSQTKWVSEKLVREAGRRGLKIAVYRPGEVCGSKETGIWKLSDMVSRFFAAGVRMGEFPDIPMNIHITPVDYIAEAIACLSIQEESFGKAFNLVNENIKRLNEIPELINAYGYDIKLIPYDEWLMKLAGSGTDNPLYPLRPLFLKNDDGSGSFMRRYGDMEAKYDMKNVRNGLANKGIYCTPVCRELIFKYLDHFIEKGYIQPPSRME